MVKVMAAVRQGYRRNKADRLRVIDLLDMGLSLGQIAEKIGIGEAQLKRFYKPELDAARPLKSKNFVANDQMRRTVAAAVAYRMPLSQIAALVGPDGISEKMLKEHFAYEIENGAAQFHFKVGNALMLMATGWMKSSGGNGVPNRVSVDAGKFLAERLFGLIAKSQVELNLAKPASEYSDDELLVIMERARASISDE